MARALTALEQRHRKPVARLTGLARHCITLGSGRLDLCHPSPNMPAIFFRKDHVKRRDCGRILNEIPLVFTMLPVSNGIYDLGYINPLGWKGVRCKSCGSTNQHRFTGEMGIHFPGMKNLKKPVVWVFPELYVCMDCGFAEFVVPEDQLRILKAANGTSE